MAPSLAAGVAAGASIALLAGAVLALALAPPLPQSLTSMALPPHLLLLALLGLRRSQLPLGPSSCSTTAPAAQSGRAATPRISTRANNTTRKPYPLVAPPHLALPLPRPPAVARGPRYRLASWAGFAPLLCVLLLVASSCGTAEAGRKRGTGHGGNKPDDDKPPAPPPPDAPPLPAAPSDFMGGPRSPWPPSVVPREPAPALGESARDAEQRESIRDLAALAVAYDQLAYITGTISGRLLAAYNAPRHQQLHNRIHDVLPRARETIRGVGTQLERLLNTLANDRVQRNLPNALPCALEHLYASAAPDSQLPHGLALYPDDLLPCGTAYHTPVLDALIWRFAGIADPTRRSQEAHLARSYPPYSLTHRRPLDGLFTVPPADPAAAAAAALAAVSLIAPAVAAAPSGLPSVSFLRPDAAVSSHACMDDTAAGDAPDGDRLSEGGGSEADEEGEEGDYFLDDDDLGEDDSLGGGSEGMDYGLDAR